MATGGSNWRADLCAAGTRTGRSGMPWRGIDPAAKGMHWKFTIDKLDELDAEGRIYWPTRGSSTRLWVGADRAIEVSM